MPYVPGRTVKGLLREAANMLSQFKKVPQDSLKRIFGLGGDDEKFWLSEYSFRLPMQHFAKTKKLTIINMSLQTICICL